MNGIQVFDGDGEDRDTRENIARRITPMVEQTLGAAANSAVRKAVIDKMVEKEIAQQVILDMGQAAKEMRKQAITKRIPWVIAVAAVTIGFLLVMHHFYG